MEAKFVYESIRDILKAKSKEELKTNLEKKFPIKDKNDATDHLKAAIYKKSIPYVEHAINHGARILDFLDSGNLWIAFNSNCPDELILKLLDTPEMVERYSSDLDLKVSILGKALYMGKYKVVEWLLNNFQHTYREVYMALANQTEITIGTTKFEGYDEAESIILNWLQKHKITESIEDILKPKSEEDVQKAIKEIDYEKYEKLVNFLLPDETNSDSYKEVIKDGYLNGLAPSIIADKIKELFYQTWEPDGYLTLSNSGGIELKMLGSEYDAVEYRFTGDKIPKTAELDYEMVTDEETMENYGYEYGDYRNFFVDEHGNKWYLDDFMKI